MGLTNVGSGGDSRNTTLVAVEPALLPKASGNRSGEGEGLRQACVRRTMPNGDAPFEFSIEKDGRPGRVRL